VVLGVAAVVCVSSAVAGELLAGFKVGLYLGGTPRSIQIVELHRRSRRQPGNVFPLMVLKPGETSTKAAPVSATARCRRRRPA